MSSKMPDSSGDSHQRQRALSRWENEGGAGRTGPALEHSPDTEQAAMPEMNNAEMVALRVRVIALENLVISLLAVASEEQLDFAREMAGYISPRPGFTQHPLTTQAADHMIDLIERASRFRQS
jgi:hypothetical protein